MITLKAKKRTEEKLGKIRKEGLIPAVLYGPKIKNITIQVDLKEFKKTHEEAGESSMFSLDVADEKEKYSVLIREVQYDVLTGKPNHVDFYQPALKEEVEVLVPLVLEGEAPVIKNLSGTLVMGVSSVKVKALPHNLPKEIVVNVSGLETFEDHILIEDLKVSKDVKILKKLNEVVISISAPGKAEEVETEEKPEEGEEAEKAEEGTSPKKELETEKKKEK